MVIGICPFIDFAFKKTFGSPENKIALIGLLNAILEGQIRIADVYIENPYNRQDFLDDKLSILDLKVTDDQGNIIDIEVQLSLKPGLVQRLVFYGCEIFADQLRTGDDYTGLKPVVVIALLRGTLWPESDQLHHRFMLTDADSGRRLSDALSIHTLELGKYNLTEADLASTSHLNRWLYWFLNADRYDAETLKRLFPYEDIAQASSALIEISQKTEEKQMYDAREKAYRDHQWAINVARREGEAEGEARGEIKIIRLLQQILMLPQSSESDLTQKPLEELQQLAADLQTQVQSRKFSE